MSSSLARLQAVPAAEADLYNSASSQFTAHGKSFNNFLFLYYQLYGQIAVLKQTKKDISVNLETLLYSHLTNAKNKLYEMWRVLPNKRLLPSLTEEIDELYRLYNESSKEVTEMETRYNALFPPQPAVTSTATILRTVDAKSVAVVAPGPAPSAPPLSILPSANAVAVPAQRPAGAMPITINVNEAKSVGQHSGGTTPTATDSPNYSPTGTPPQAHTLQRKVTPPSPGGTTAVAGVKPAFEGVVHKRSKHDDLTIQYIPRKKRVAPPVVEPVKEKDKRPCVVM